MNLLICNVGSTSLKFKLYSMPSETVLSDVKIERVGSTDSAILNYHDTVFGNHVYRDGLCIPDYSSGIRLFLNELAESAKISVQAIEAIGFKSVLSKGYTGVHLLTDEVINGMREYLFIAPVHNAAYIEAISQFQEIIRSVPMVGVFETAFHKTIPQERRMYSIPYTWYKKYGIEKMGYHGASHSYVASKAREYGKSDRIISCHLGGSCSVCAIRDGKSTDSSFGFSLQTGVMHANRCGTVDPYIVPFLLNEGMPLNEITDGLSQNGGLKGLSQVSNDLREVMREAQSGNDLAKLAVDVFVTDVLRYIGAFYVELGGLDQLVFTGGIGENSAEIREMVCSRLSFLDVAISQDKNCSLREGVISTDTSKVVVSIVAANEELGVARQAYREILRIRGAV